nr:putative reverse transcriptase domain-containing protein [Tanacetum cinerariifolium]
MVSEPKMVNTRTDAELAAAVQNALQTLLPQIRAEIREEFRTSSGPSDSGGNPPPVTIHTWLERFNKQKPRLFEKATAPVHAENWISHMEKIFDVMGFRTLCMLSSLGESMYFFDFPVCYPNFFKTLCLLKYALMKRHDYDVTVFFTKRGVTIMVSEPEIREEFRTSSGPSDSGGNPPPITIHTWLERFNKQKPHSFEKATTPVDAENWISHMEKIFDVMGCVTREIEVSSPTDLSILVSSSPGVPLRATPTRYVLRVDANTQESVVELLADKKPGASSRVFTITEDHATKTSGTITGTLFIYGRAVFVLFDTGATHSVISSVFASSITTTPTLLDHVLCISTPMKDSVRITHVYRDLPLQFDDKIRVINALPLDMCEFDIILGMDWLTEHHAMIDCRSYRVIFGDIHAPEFIYHGSLPGKSMQIISALQA